MLPPPRRTLSLPASLMLAAEVLKWEITNIARETLT
jgi:hypothetical protein